MKAKTAKTVLRHLNVWFKRRDVQTAEKEMLLNILSALRGPDSCAACGYDMKLASTAIIRQAVLPSTKFHWNEEEDSLKHRRFRQGLSHECHFIDHAKKAFEGLKLLWT